MYYYSIDYYPNLSCYLIAMIDIEFPKYINEFIENLKTVKFTL